ncbi:unnamed protein product [Toxocara canis]|uniref:Autophagy-related protein 13 n=1 Tax=Toxocara canis TaxID=6265 RepID=A0A183U4H1_TOXCA|nr:unnamed protein product [Toxocara canis]
MFSGSIHFSYLGVLHVTTPYAALCLYSLDFTIFGYGLHIRIPKVPSSWDEVKAAIRRFMKQLRNDPFTRTFTVICANIMRALDAGLGSGRAMPLEESNLKRRLSFSSSEESEIPRLVGDSIGDTFYESLVGSAQKNVHS